MSSRLAVVADLLARLPGQVVVPVDDRVLGEEVADPGRGVRGHARTLLGVHGAGPRRELEWLHGRPPRAAAASRWSPSAAPATRSTPRSSPAGSRPRAGRLVDDAADADVARGQHLRLRRAGQEGLRRHAARGRRPQGRPAAPRPSSRSAAWPSATARTSPSRCPRPTRCSASTTTPTSPPGCASILGRRDAPTRTRPQDRRTLLPLSPVDRGRGRAARARPRPGPTGRRGPATGPRAVRRRLDGGPWPPLKLASGCDRRCSFCAIPTLPRLVRLPPPDRRARRGALAGRAGRPRAVPGQRELHVLRQGPRRPAAARDAAARAGRGRRRRAGAGVLPAAGRDPARPGRGDRRRRPASCRYFDLSFQHASPTGAAPDAPVRRPRARSSTCSSRSARRAPLAGRPLQRHRRLPRRDRGRPRRAERFLVAARLDVVGVFGYSDEDGTEAATLRRQAATTTRSRDRVEHVTALVEELTAQRAEERIGETVEVLVEAVDDDGRRRRGPGRAPGPRGRRHHHAARPAGRRCRVGDLVARRRRRHRGRRPGRGARDAAIGDRRRAARPRRRPGQPAGRATGTSPNALTVAAARAGAGLRLAAARRRRRLDRRGAGSPSALFAVAMITDRIDGDIARSRGLVTNFGKIADPIADKALTGDGVRRPVDPRRALVVGHHRGPGPRVGHHRCCGSG